eukprot:CAMPEP_0203864294 /NCGR_PEP_ID=MMETSP0359-20131031/14676_1 /ASSEMBLY_ACC=CAM_ASM_000338 /TAXON_ID=268821 /ORGANISM="Scrippsiella Hangoei, Strain SHTV-5" /LENGTH=243 /DNA_ID=CAMNT_0050782003 /DNA_START=60 /DNA_END=791 /DNA_ORIENTATION=+
MAAQLAQVTCRGRRTRLASSRRNEKRSHRSRSLRQTTTEDTEVCCAAQAPQAVPEVQRPAHLPAVEHQFSVNLVLEAEALVTEVDDRVVHGLAAVMERLVSSAKAPQGAAQALTKFHGVRAPGISIGEYVMRIRKFFHCSVECFVLALVYIDRMTKKHPDIVVGHLTCHRIVLCSMMLSAKFQDDVFYKNTFYGKVGGLALAEVNALEKHMLQMMDYRLHVMPEEFELYRSLLCKAAEGAGAC